MEKEDIKEYDFEKEYEPLKKKYDLPELEKLGEDFDIEKLFEKESHFLLREIRRAMLDKISAYLNLFETLINPSSPPMFVFSVLRSIGEDDKTKIKEIYRKLSKIQIRAMALDTIYDETKEADFIKNMFKEWQELKKIICEVFKGFEENSEKDNGSKKSSYFG